MKTLFLMEMYGERDTFFFELKGDYSRLNRVIINGMHSSHYNSNITSEEYEKLQEELWSMLYENDEDFDVKVKKLEQPTKRWDHFCHIGFMP